MLGCGHPSTGPQSPPQTPAPAPTVDADVCDRALANLQKVTGVRARIRGWHERCAEGNPAYAQCIADATSLEDIEQCAADHKAATASLEHVELLGASVAYDRPTSWGLIQDGETAERALVAYFVPYPATDDTPHSANAVISAVPLETVGVAAFSDQSMAALTVPMSRVSDEYLSENARRIISTGEEHDAVYTVIDHFAVNEAHTVGVHLRFAYPNLDGLDTWDGLPAFEALVASLTFATP